MSGAAIAPMGGSAMSARGNLQGGFGRGFQGDYAFCYLPVLFFPRPLPPVENPVLSPFLFASPNSFAPIFQKFHTKSAAPAAAFAAGNDAAGSNGTINATAGDAAGDWVSALSRAQNITEELKAKDMMAWVQEDRL